MEAGARIKTAMHRRLLSVSGNCHTDPDAKHGPYYYWTTKKGGKTVSRSLSQEQAVILQEWIDNRRELEHVTEQMKKLSQDAYEATLFLAEGSP